MSEYFHAKVKYLRQHSNGLVKQETAQYLIDAMSFTEAESRAMDEAGSGLREVQAVAISRSPIKEVVMYGDTDMWHKVKVTYSLMDEETEKEKKITTYLLVNSNDVKEAYERTEEHLKEMLVPFQIPKIEESPIIEVFQYEKQAPKGFVKVAGSVRDAADNIIESNLGAPSDDHHEEECAMESDAVEAIDPTAGQAVAFDLPEDLLSILDEEGLNLNIAQLKRVTEQAESLPRAEFISWIGVTFDIGSRASAEIWEVLNDR